jgi:catalase
MLEVKPVQERVINELLVNVHPDLAERVAQNVGLKVIGKPKTKPHDRKSPALSMDKPVDAIKGMKVAILAGDGVDGKQVAQMKKMLTAQGAMGEVISRVAGTINAADGKEIVVDKAAPNAPSVAYDAVFIPGGQSAATLAKLGIARHFVSEAFAHYKTVGAMGEGADVLKAAGVQAGGGKKGGAIGVVTADANGDFNKFFEAFAEAMKKPRHFDRDVAMIPA